MTDDDNSKDAPEATTTFPPGLAASASTWAAPESLTYADLCIEIERLTALGDDMKLPDAERLADCKTKRQFITRVRDMA